MGLFDPVSALIYQAHTHTHTHGVPCASVTKYIGAQFRLGGHLLLSNFVAQMWSPTPCILLEEAYLIAAEDLVCMYIYIAEQAE